MLTETAVRNAQSKDKTSHDHALIPPLVNNKMQGN